MEPSNTHLTTEQLFRRHAGFVARFLGQLGLPPEQLDDGVQEVFLVVHRQGGYRPGLAKPTSYLANIALRIAARIRQRHGVARRRHSDAALEGLPGALEDPARAYQVQQDLDRLQQALGRLPEELRTPLLLVDMEGESCVSVAAGLGCPVGTVYWRLHKARHRLQTALSAVDRSRRRPHPTPATAQLGEPAVPARSMIMLFGFGRFHGSEAERLLQLARQQPPSLLPMDELLTRHQELIRSGAELPAWANALAPRARPGSA